MESIHSPKRPGAARAGAVAGGLLFALLVLLPGVWYGVYHDQLATPAARTVPFGVALPPRPAGLIFLGPPVPGQPRAMQIQHTGGQVITTVIDGDLRITARETDPHPPSNPLDDLGQSLCDRYNAWKCEKGDPSQPPNGFMGTGMGTMTIQMNFPPNSPPPPAHAPGTRAPR